ncbi:unnamed protein product (macronuclear) [Paramecium tetraurelia]|uniref:BEACH domain-containing protein n=1 Tax=Paramecium tetraurelia TaxID=5888 RepID=A0DNR3_PARTE|nr:uncharacterized protein GSPATT00018876001 [Paramecium tetraurelia]CAK84680.1 unnamed protein product [Paramecium tetraurelia]|eukprot:XP_001452077.1 hypothetical protein (macronuclear) [Paramecium tetraurelia strain d4-2]
MKSFNSFLKLLHIQWEQICSDDISDSVRDKLKSSLQNQTILESRFISLSKTKSENPQEYESFFAQERDSPFFSTYLLICTVIKEYYSQTDNMLSELSPSLLSSSSTQQQITIESIIDCMDNLLYEYEKLTEINLIVKSVIFEVFYQVGGNVTIFVKNLMLNNDQQHLPQKYVKAFINLQKLLKLNISLNFKEKQKILPFIYQMLLGNALYFAYLDEIEYQNFMDIFSLFQQCFLENYKQLQELSDIEQFQEVPFCQVYSQCLKQKYQQQQYSQFLQSNVTRWIDQIKEFNDINYYLIFVYLIQATEFVDIINFDIEIIKIRNLQIINLVKQKNNRVVGHLFNQILQNPQLQSHMQYFDEIFQHQNHETKLIYFKLIGEQLLQINNTQIIDQYLCVHLNGLKEFINVNNLSTQQLIQFITYLCRYYNQFNQNQKREFDSLIIQFYSQEIKDEQYYKKFDQKILQLLEDEQIYQQIIDIAIKNSSRSKQHSYGFLVFIQDSISINSESLPHILKFIHFLMGSCKINKKKQNKRNINYKKGKGTRILDFLLSNMRIFITIIKNVYDLMIKESNFNSVEKQHQLYTEIYHKITYIIYLIYWLIEDKSILNSGGIQQISLELCQIHYKFTINLIVILQKTNNLSSNTLYQIINNINSIAHGYDYINYIKESYFDKNNNLINPQDVFEQLNEKRVQMKLIFNKFYETSLSILFEVPNITIDRTFYLQILRFQLKTQISLVLSFTDFCPKFIFYFRIERDPEVISLMKQCAIIVVSLNQDPQIIKQLFETLSYHQSTILMNDLDEMQLDVNDKDDIQQAYRLANLSPYRIPLLLQSSLLLRLVDDKNYYIKVVKIILEIFLQVYQQWQEILQSLQKQSNLLYFQGGSSSIQVNLNLVIPIQLIEIRMKLRLIVQENETPSMQYLDRMSFGSFLVNSEYVGKLIIFTLIFAKNQEIQISINKQKFIITYKQDEYDQEEGISIKFDLSQWFNLNFYIKNNNNNPQMILEINETKYTLQFKLPQNQILQLNQFVLGVTLNFDIEQSQQMNKKQKFQTQFLDSFIFLNQSFDGQISEFNFIINDQKIKFEQSSNTNLQKQTKNFINSGVIIEEEIEFDDIFLITPCRQIQPIMCSQNVYILDMKKGLDFIQKSGGYNVFYMALDVLYAVYENTNLSDSEEILILILKLFEEDIQRQASQVSRFVDSRNLKIFEEHCKQWIQINQQVSDQFIKQLLSIFSKIGDEKTSIQYLITVIKILDNKITTVEQMKLIFKSIVIQTLLKPENLNQLISVQLYFESRQIFTQVSLTKAKPFINLESNNLFSHSLTKCIQYQGVVRTIDFPRLSEFFNLLLSQEQFNLFTLDILQIIEVLIVDLMKSKSKLKSEEDNLLNSYKKNIVQILDKQNKFHTINQYFMYESEVFDKLYELTFSIYVSIVQKQRVNSKKDTELGSLQIYYDYFSPQTQTEVGYFFISKILSLISQNEKDENLIHQLLKFLNQLYANQQIKDAMKETLTSYFLDIFKSVVLRKQQSEVLIMNLMQFSDFALLMKHLMPHSINKKQNSSELFTYFIIYLIEVYPKCTSEILYKVHIESNLFNKDSFNSFLQAIYPIIIQFYAMKQVQQFQGQEDERKLISIITAYLHIEQCFGEISDQEFVNWNLYSQIMDKGIDLFNYLDVLFYDRNFYMPENDDNFNWDTVKQEFEKQRKQSNRVLPNGGIKRLMRQLIAPYVKVPQMKKPIKNYLSINKKNCLDGKIDQQSCLLVKKLIDKEFSAPLLQTKKIQLKNYNQLFQDAGFQRVKQKETIVRKSRTRKHSNFYQSLIYYALSQDSSFDETQIKNLQEIFGKYQLTKLYEWKNVNQNYVECLIYQQEASQDQILMALNQLNKIRTENKQNNLKSLQNTFDLSQIDQIREDTAFAIQQSIFMDFQIYYQFVHKIWLLFPKIADFTEMPKTQSNLSAHHHSSFSEMSIPIFRDSAKKYWDKECLDLKQRQGLWFFVDDYLQVLYQELNNFISHQEFKFEVLENMQMKMQVCHLEDITRRRPHLTQIKMKNFYKPYLKTNNQARKKLITLEESSIDKSKSNINTSFTILLQKSDNIEESLSQSLIKRAKRRSSIRSEQLITNQASAIISSFRKGSSDSNQLVTAKYFCEYITQEAAYQGVLRFNDKNQSLIFKSEKIDIKELFTSPEVKQTTEEIFLEISLSQILSVHPKRFLLNEIAIEIFLHRQNFFFNLYRYEKQQELVSELKRKKVQVVDPIEEFRKRNYQQNWVGGQLSNFQYLMLVNTFSGRTYNDLSQYFIFPWVISNYKSQQIDFAWRKQGNQLRNLKLPMGAISKKSEDILKDYKERDLDCIDENFMYGSHYSNAAIVFNYLIRLEPFNELHFSLQKNKFDVADRLFSKIDILWENSVKQDNKELIPEFYYMPEFLRNINFFDFGTLQSQSRVTDVELPKWVKTQTAEEFVYRMRQALESDAVSSQLNHWIDLIFGINNNGQNAVENVNVFHYLTYEQNLQLILNKNEDHGTIQSYLTQVYYFGQTPKQLFQKAHQKKKYSLSLYTNQIPYFGENPNKANKGFIYQSKLDLDKSSILGFYPYSKKCFYILKADNDKYNHLTLLETKQQEEEGYYYYHCQPKQLAKLPEIKVDGCNPQNMFTFIYEQEHYFGDGFDSQFYSIYEEKQNYNLYFCLVGFLDKSVKIYDLKNKMTELRIDVSISNAKRQKRASCVRYHAVTKILAVGSLDGLLQLFQLQFGQQIQAKGVLSKQLRNGIVSIDLTDLNILTVDQKNIASLFTLEGDLLQTIQLDNSDKISQCCIQLHFLVFKSSNSQISLYTINGKQYLQTIQLMDKVSKNILFTTPFSSKFLLYSSNQQGDEIGSRSDPFIYYYDIFDLKLQQQQLGIYMSRRGAKRGSGVQALHISFDRCLITEQNEIKHIYLIAIDNQILFYLDEQYDQRLVLRQKLKEGGLSII